MGQMVEEQRTMPPLIVSYSYSGNTYRIAQQLQAMTGGDWCEIHPWQPYPAAFPALLEQVRHEVRVGCRPRLLPGSKNPKPYSVIFVGTPNWCGTIAPPLASWLAGNDLSGKIVLPFCSHCGGVAGNIQNAVAKICPKADVRAALYIMDDGGVYLPETLRQWLGKTDWGSPALGRQCSACASQR